MLPSDETTTDFYGFIRKDPDLALKELLDSPEVPTDPFIVVRKLFIYDSVKHAAIMHEQSMLRRLMTCVWNHSLCIRMATECIVILRLASG